MGLRDKRPHRVGSPAPGGDPHRRRPLTWMGRRPGVGSAHLHTKDQSVRHRRAAAGRRSSRTPGRAAGDVTWKWQHSSSSQGCPAQRGGRLMAPRLRAPSGRTPDALPPSGRPNFHFPRKGTFSQVPERGRSASAQRVRRSRPQSPRVSSSPANPSTVGAHARDGSPKPLRSPAGPAVLSGVPVCLGRAWNQTPLSSRGAGGREDGGGAGSWRSRLPRPSTRWPAPSALTQPDAPAAPARGGEAMMSGSGSNFVRLCFSIYTPRRGVLPGS